MRKTRKVYTKEFKESAVELCLRGERTMKSIAGELGIHPTLLGQWVRASEEEQSGGLKAFPGHGKARDEELARLRKEVADLRETNEILKKAMAIFTIRTPR
jgi:transposase